MSQTSSRKRAAPGASPSLQSQPQTARYSTRSSQPLSDSAYQWNQNLTRSEPISHPDTVENYNPVIYNNMARRPTAQEPPNQLTRRPLNHQMMARAQYNNGGGEMWNGMMDESNQRQQTDMGFMPSMDDAKLLQEAREAKETAQKSRKSIPPFVLKLRSFLDQERNTDLIRWSTNGDSFVVLDEEEFARTLIPELFKHANYASFVRQLNMYGFHKKVGLSDNSMRASERKNKSPSEYSNPYFRRDHKDLMWLIQKPKSTQGKGKGRKQGDSNAEDDEEQYDVDPSTAQNQTSEDRPLNLPHPRQPLLLGQGEMAIAQDELAAVHRELGAIRQQHQMISGYIQKLRRDHEAILQQNAAWQELHTRHENSINAILTFLATIYNRSLDGHANQNIANMFTGSLPHDVPQQGSVLDVGDVSTPNSTQNGSIRQPSRRQPLLLKAAPDNAGNGTSRDQPTSRGDSLPGQQRRAMKPRFRPAQQSTVEEIYDQDSPRNPSAATSTQFLGNSNLNEQLPERDIMSLINSANAKDAESPFANRMDFPEALSHLQTADGNSPLSQNERNGVLRLMASNSANADNANANNALTAPDPPNLPLPNMENWQATSEDLAFLEQSLREQEDKMLDLSNRIQPLSPSGRIPGLNDPQGYIPPPNDALDFDQIFNSNDYFNDAGANLGDPGGDQNFGSGGGDFNFDGPLDMNPGADYGSNNLSTNDNRVVESVNSSEATSPENVLDDGGTQELDRSPRKRQRRS